MLTGKIECLPLCLFLLSPFSDKLSSDEKIKVMKVLKK